VAQPQRSAWLRLVIAAGRALTTLAIAEPEVTEFVARPMWGRTSAMPS